jgi:hypothetical protein
LPQLRALRSVNAKGSNNHFSRDIYAGVTNPFFGRNHSDDSRRKMRVAVANRIRDTHGVCIDKGAKEFFADLNAHGFNFQEGYHLQDLGFFADGYDPAKHTWVEFDTAYHKRPNQRRKDLTRQQAIIKHFESIGKPLGQFLRYDAGSNKTRVAYRSRGFLKYLYN